MNLSFECAFVREALREVVREAMLDATPWGETREITIHRPSYGGSNDRPPPEKVTVTLRRRPPAFVANASFACHYANLGARPIIRRAAGRAPRRAARRIVRLVARGADAAPAPQPPAAEVDGDPSKRRAS